MALRAGLGLAALAWLVTLTWCDLRDRRLPDTLTLPGAAAALAGAGLLGRGLPALAGAAGLAGLYLLVHLLRPAGLGGGDVKLALGVGAITGCFGPAVWTLAALGAPLLTAGWGLLAARRGVAAVPHAPAMALTGVAAVALTVL
ncbi:prepilin peptidase [Mycolicibacillus trivialis]|uniref:Prepilin type IV endopeptidase peptidase domain-containing protein n=1 Tax=Mycolicibacillus trivialis TaxID=1798 RepID=A0A1X2EPE3_9MYCO|nr:prepilin peptidase [Mycolicibacillus trivialis]ORX07935.1 hypothetical protein AWC30_03180 [Mycolicibacillus trivialis]